MNTKKPPKVFIIILGYNGADFIKKCLNSVFNVVYQDLSVVFVDNDSHDGTMEIAKKNFSKAFFIKNKKNLGFAAGMNVGIRFAIERMADYVLLLNQDTEVDSDFVKRLVDVGEKDEKIGVLSPVVFGPQGERVWFSGGKIEWAKMKIRHFQDSFPQSIRESEFISGCSMMIKKEVFKKIGLLDEDFFLYYEDADFSLRSRRSGFKSVVVSGSWVYHAEDSNSEKLSENKLYWLVLSGLIFFSKNYSGLKKLWIRFYIKVRKTKNLKDQFLKSNKKKTEIIKKAFNDFKNVP